MLLISEQCFYIQKPKTLGSFLAIFRSIIRYRFCLVGTLRNPIEKARLLLAIWFYISIYICLQLFFKYWYILYSPGITFELCVYWERTGSFLFNSLYLNVNVQYLFWWLFDSEYEQLCAFFKRVEKLYWHKSIQDARKVKGGSFCCISFRRQTK